MNLNLPIVEQLASAQSILVAGMGGGFDVLCGLPIYSELRRQGKTVHLANLSFSDLDVVPGRGQLSPTLAAVTADITSTVVYFPELYLTRWFRELRGEEVTVWCFAKSGVRPLVASYRALVRRLGVDAIVLVDGGVDSVMRGDETKVGTLLEDTISLAAVDELTEVPTRIVACLGFGAELDMSYAHALENIAGLARDGAYLGSCSLVRQMEAYADYDSAVCYIHSQPYQEPSVINASVVSAVRGHYGNYHLTERTRGSKLWISPLMALYWFFELPAVARRNMLAPHLATTTSFNDAVRESYWVLGMIKRRPDERIPLT